MFTKVGALRVLIRDMQLDRPTKASYERTVKALRVLGLTEAEQGEILVEMEYHQAPGFPHMRYVRVSEKRDSFQPGASDSGRP